MIQKQMLKKLIIPVIYTIAILTLVLYQWNQQIIVWQGPGHSEAVRPLYRNLMEYPAYVRHGFDLSEVQSMPSKLPPPEGNEWQPVETLLRGETWFRFTAPQLRIRNSPLPNLPKRGFLSPRGREAQEFTIIIPIELGAGELSYVSGGGVPGIFFGYIGENWEIYFNGELVQREMHVIGGQITSRRNWRDVHFPIDSSLLKDGYNILSLRIIGDPTLGLTGLYYASPYYLDDYELIKRRNLNIIEMILCGIFGYTGIYYLIIFLSFRKRQEFYNLYYSLFSILLCIYTLMRTGMVNAIIPNSDISIRLEFLALFMIVPMLSLFIEQFGRQKITKVSWCFLIFYGILSLTQIFFSTQYGADVLMIWSASVFIYFSYVFFYDVVYVYFWIKRKEKKGDAFFLHILIGSVLVYICGIFDVLDTLFFYYAVNLFVYSTFVLHIGMAITLSQRLRGMYQQLEESNIILEEKVQERTLELKEQTTIALEASQAALEASKAKSNFLAIMSHEIRTPLNAVIGFSEIELRNEHPLSTRESFTHIHRSGSFLLGIINEILDISKIESGKLDLIPNEYETAPLISGTADLNRIRIGEKPIQFMLEIDAGFPAKLIGDELRVKQILNNLLSNAIKYTNEGSVKLEVKSEKIKDNNEPSSLASSFSRITFSVSDTGIGIRPEDIDKLFDNYTQLDTQANRRNEGIGLGLVITKNLAEMMGGGISIESEYGKGSCFTLWIIQEQKDSEIIGEETVEDLRNFSYAAGFAWKEKTQTSITPLNIPDARVLVVDDIPENLLVVRGFLKPYGLQIDTVGSGQEAIEIVQKRRSEKRDYKLIFMDHMMPEMDGVQTLKVIRAWEQEQNSMLSIPYPQVPIIVLTSNALKGMNEFYMDHGFQDFLAKPVNQQELDETVKKWVKVDDAINLPATFSAELDMQRLDRLNHFCYAFDSGFKIEAEYFKKFTAFIESLNTDNPLAAVLIEAGRKEDAETIRKNLSAFYEAMEKQSSAVFGQFSEENIQAMVQQIKKALQNGDAEAAKKIRKAMGAIKLSPTDRELYFALYESSLLDENEQALKAIAQWEEEKT